MQSPTQAVGRQKPLKTLPRVGRPDRGQPDWVARFDQKSIPVQMAKAGVRRCGYRLHALR
jgi:hypothetical protein